VLEVTNISFSHALSLSRFVIKKFSPPSFYNVAPFSLQSTNLSKFYVIDKQAWIMVIQQARKQLEFGLVLH